MTRDELIEKVARIICKECGYIWDGDEDDAQTAPYLDLPYDERPSKVLFKQAATSTIDTIFAALKEPTQQMKIVVSKNWGRRTWEEYKEVINASPLNKGE